MTKTKSLGCDIAPKSFKDTHTIELIDQATELWDKYENLKGKNFDTEKVRIRKLHNEIADEVNHRRGRKTLNHLHS